jgi:acetyl-CoA carboxylase carboxyl transferase subunit alpha
MSTDVTQFEEPILRVRREIDDLMLLPEEERDQTRLSDLNSRLQKLSREIYGNLTPWQKTLVARNQNRPYTLDFISHLFTDFVEIHGDRNFGDDPAIVAGFAKFDGQACAVIGHQKGRDTKEKIARNFGMPRPEGYRKALRVMRLAEKFRRPIFTLIDTPGAYPGVGAEERGQAEAIAVNLEVMAGLQVPIIVTVTGEGGSGGALALGVGDRIFMFEHAVYSVISPEGCAAILWKNPAAAQDAAQAMKITAQDLASLGIIDEIIPEPPGGAHTDHARTAENLRPLLLKAMRELMKMKPSQLPEERYKKFRRMGVFDRV